MEDDDSIAREARALLRGGDAGVLSTHSKALPGYPFGSITPFAVTPEGQPLVYVSTIAQHTANMLADARVCLTAVDRGAGNQQALGRIALVGDATQLDGAEAEHEAERYFRVHPEAREYAQTHGFVLFRIQPVRVRYIAGFGRIHWIERAQWLLPAPAWREHEGYVVEHMNADHADALRRMCAREVGEPADFATERAELVAVDPEGLQVRAGERLVRVAFGARCDTLAAVRAETVRLARA